MSAEAASILEQWLKLTMEEAAAIESSAWSAVRRIQARKAMLRETLATAAPKPSRAKAARILSLLTRNGEALAAKLRQARARQDLLDQGKRNLRRIQRSYLRPQTSAAWHSYS